MLKNSADYNIDYWGEGYFSINQQGEVQVNLGQGDAPRATLINLVNLLKNQGVRLPVLVRFKDILKDRVIKLSRAFNQATRTLDFQGHYCSVYPIKVNQQRAVVESLLSARDANDFIQVGLEAGSKPELLAVLALSDRPQSVIVCNGYKDREYIQLALAGNQLGLRVFIVVEKLNELERVIEEAKKFNIAPLIGVRARLTSIGKGNWQNTGGTKGKFGLSPREILLAIDKLKEANMLSSLKMLHFHMGSQISDVEDIQHCMQEACQYFIELHLLGVAIDHLDVGGGLSVDYEGSRSSSYYSMNYSIEEYAYHIIKAIKDACQQHHIPHPNVITESGRALTAHHAVLITDVIEGDNLKNMPLIEPDQACHRLYQDIWEVYINAQQEMNPRDLMDRYHRARFIWQESQTLFQHGAIRLKDRALIESIHYAICRELRTRLRVDIRVHRQLEEELDNFLAEKLFVNFSVFQSLPDVWGIDQIFPILPLEGLKKDELLYRAKLHDMTCDSDGRIDRYVDDLGVETTLPLPLYQDNKPYYLGFFLVGAYQEILGDMHNLFGDTDSIEVGLDNAGDFVIHSIKWGDTVADVLRYVDFDSKVLEKILTDRIDASHLSDDLKKQFHSLIKEGLNGYTYLE